MYASRTLASLAVVCGLAMGASLSAQSQSNPPAPVPAQPGQPTQPGQGTPARPGETPSRPGQPQDQARAPQAERTVSITGCVARDANRPAGQASAQATDMFILTNAKAATDGAAAAGSTSTTIAREYRLMAGDGVNLTPHLNHQVRVTGTVKGVGQGTGGRAAAPGAAQSATTMAPMFHVTQLTMVSATCETK